jgi:hypothetical protein
MKKSILDAMLTFWGIVGLLWVLMGLFGWEYEGWMRLGVALIGVGTIMSAGAFRTSKMYGRINVTHQRAASCTDELRYLYARPVNVLTLAHRPDEPIQAWLSRIDDYYLRRGFPNLDVYGCALCGAAPRYHVNHLTRALDSAGLIPHLYEDIQEY